MEFTELRLNFIFIYSFHVQHLAQEKDQRLSTDIWFQERRGLKGFSTALQNILPAEFCCNKTGWSLKQTFNNFVNNPTDKKRNTDIPGKEVAAPLLLVEEQYSLSKGSSWPLYQKQD